MLKACIFDLDGTLAYTLESMAVIANKVLADLGLAPLPVDNFRFYCGEGASVLIKRCLKDAGDPSLSHFEEADRAYRERFNQDPLFMVRPYDGMAEALQALKKEGALLGVCSNKPHAATVKVVTALFGGVFDAVQGQESGIQRKPAPDGALKLAEAFHAEPSECLYIGDTWVDMETGRAAGMPTVGALWGYRGREELEKGGARVLAASPAELPGIYISERRSDHVFG